jgi:hypothetical protein
MAPTGEFEGRANGLQAPEGPLPGQATTGLTSEQFDELVERVGARIVWDYGRGRPRELTLHQAVKAVVMYFRTNITQELIAELLFVDQSTLSRSISDLEEIIAEALDEFVPELPTEIEGRVAIADGSLCPCWSWADARELYSGKHKTTGHAHQFVCDLVGHLMHISDPLPGSTHDAKAIHETGQASFSARTTQSAIRVTLEPASSPRIASRPAENFLTGKKDSTPRSTRSAT